MRCGLIETMKSGHHPIVKDDKGQAWTLHYDRWSDGVMVFGPGLQQTIDGIDIPVWLVEWFQQHQDGRGVEWID